MNDKYTMREVSHGLIEIQAVEENYRMIATCDNYADALKVCKALNYFDQEGI